MHDLCTVEDCDRNTVGRGLCRRHYHQAWVKANADHLREYQRRYYGMAARRDATCGGCGKAVRTYRAGDYCPSCRSQADRIGRVCETCSAPLWKTRRPRFCSDRCREQSRGSASGGHASPAYLAAVAQGDRIDRSSVYARDEGTCRLCGDTVDAALPWPAPASASIDHIVPISKGGEHRWENVQLAHLACNWRKGRTVAA